MGIIQNFDLFSVGIAVAAIGILGFVVFLNNRKNDTSRAFLFFSLTSIFWSVVNYLNYQTYFPGFSFWILRLTIFAAVWHAFFIFQFFYIFPREEVKLPKWYKLGLIPFVVFVALLTLTPFVFSHVEEFSLEGRILKVIQGPAMPVFGITVSGLVFAALIMLIRKTLKASGVERRQFKIVLWGACITFALLIMFNLVLPSVFQNPSYIPLGAFFHFPFLVATFYAIVRYRLFSVKVIATEILTFILAMVVFVEILGADEVSVIIFRSFTFILVLIFGILLIRSVLHEVKQREKLEQLTKELEEKNIKLEKLDQLKSEFLSFASHQVKAPMTAVKGYASLVYDGTLGPVSDQVKDVAVKIKDSADRLIGLVNNLLDLRKIEEGRMDFSFEKADAAQLVRKIADELKPLAIGKKLTFVCEVAQDSIMAALDIQKFSQVVQNLIDNAIKYTEQGEVRVTVDYDYSDDHSAKYVLIVVSDSGRGMPAELLPKLFSQFTRDPSVKKSIQGTGLGLYIAKQIVTAHKGEIWAESEGEGKGSGFFVRIPAV